MRRGSAVTMLKKHDGTWQRKVKPMYQWLILLLVAILFFTACSSDEQETAVVEEKELEAYIEEDDEEEISNPYDYLSTYTLVNEVLSVEVYLPSDEEIEEGLDDVEASLSGITVHLAIEEPDITIEDIVEREAEEITEQGREDVEYETNGNIGYIQYIINKNDEELYPCARVIKQDELTEDYYLYIIIDINNMLADDDSEAVLGEVGDAYGIVFG